MDCFLESVDCKKISLCTACVVTLKIKRKLMSQQNNVFKIPKFKLFQVI